MPGQLSLFDDGGMDRAAPPLAPPGVADEGRRHAIFDGRLVAYRFARTRRRTIAISVDADGLSVRAPRRVPWREIDAFLAAQRTWILARLDEWAGLPPPRVLHGVSGDVLPHFGIPLALEVRAGRGGCAREDGRLVVRVRAPERRDRVRARVLDWLRAETLGALAPRAAHYAARLGRPAPRVSVSNARRQWGLCTESGEIRLSWRLAHLAPELADYVVAHEAAHLAELNHSKRFWALVGSLYPDWRGARERLERVAASLPRIGR